MSKAERPMANIPRPAQRRDIRHPSAMATTWSKVMTLMLDQLFEAQNFVETGEYEWHPA